MRSAYVHDAMSLEAASEVGQVSFGTVARWKKEAKAEGDCWEKARAARLMSADGADSIAQAVLEEFVTVFQATIVQLKNATDLSPMTKADALAKLSDAFHKTISAARKGSPEVNKMAVARDVLMLLAEFVGTKYPQHGQVLLDILEPFGDYLTANLVK